MNMATQDSFSCNMTLMFHQAYDDRLLKTGNIICCSNLMDKSPYRSRQLPTVEASNEFTHITNKPQNSEQRQAVTRLNSAFKVGCSSYFGNFFMAVGG